VLQERLTVTAYSVRRDAYVAAACVYVVLLVRKTIYSKPSVIRLQLIWMSDNMKHEKFCSQLSTYCHVLGVTIDGVRIGEWI
jgi:hypothetical protein